MLCLKDCRPSECCHGLLSMWHCQIPHWASKKCKDGSQQATLAKSKHCWWRWRVLPQASASLCCPSIPGHFSVSILSLPSQRYATEVDGGAWWQTRKKTTVLLHKKTIPQNYLPLLDSGKRVRYSGMRKSFFFPNPLCPPTPFRPFWIG